MAADERRRASVSVSGVLPADRSAAGYSSGPRFGASPPLSSHVSLASLVPPPPVCSAPSGSGSAIAQARAIVVATAAAGQEGKVTSAPALDTLAAAGEAVRCASAASALLPSQLRYLPCLINNLARSATHKYRTLHGPVEDC